MTNEVTQKTTSDEQNVSSSNGLEPKIRFKCFNENWHPTTIGNVFTFINGKAHEQNVVEFGNYVIVNSKFISTDGEVKKYSDAQICPLYKGDIVMVMSDVPNGKAMSKCLLINSNDRYTLNQRICALRTKYTPLFYMLQISRNDYFMKFDDGVKQTNLRKGDVLGCPLFETSLPEQEKIAAFLSLVDARIEKQRQLVESLKKYKRGLLFAIFDRKIRFKDDNGTNFPDWEFKTVADVFKITRGYVLPATDTLDAPTKDFCYPVYSSQTKNYGLLGYYNQYLYSDAITWTTDGANAGYVKFRKDKFYCTNVCGVLISDKGMANSYIAEKLNSITKRHVSYVGNPKLMNNVMAEITIEFPSIKEQQKLSGYIDNIEYLINMNNELLEKLNFYKRGLLQQMFI